MEKIFYPEPIRLFLEKVCKDIIATLNPEYVLIAGSFGKGSWLFHENNLLSDFELVFVCNSKWPLRKKKKLLKEINVKYPYDISLKGYLTSHVTAKNISNYSKKPVGYISLDFYDAFSDPVYLYCKNDEPLNIQFHANEIPLWEAWRLFVNRIAELLSAEANSNNDLIVKRYSWLKMYETLADVYLMLHRQYSKKIEDRIKMFKCLSDEKGFNLCDQQIMITINNALLARKKHDLSLFRLDSIPYQSMDCIEKFKSMLERQIIDSEKILINKLEPFEHNYLNHKILQKKYLGFNSKNAIIYSNLLKFIGNPKSVILNIKFLSLHNSLRHHILILIAVLFSEIQNNSRELTSTRKIAQRIFYKKSFDNLDHNAFILFALSKWKYLR